CFQVAEQRSALVADTAINVQCALQDVRISPVAARHPPFLFTHRSKERRHHKILIVWHRFWHECGQIEPLAFGFPFAFEVLPRSFAAPVLFRDQQGNQSEKTNQREQRSPQRFPTKKPTEKSREQRSSRPGRILGCFHCWHINTARDLRGDIRSLGVEPSQASAVAAAERSPPVRRATVPSRRAEPKRPVRRHGPFSAWLTAHQD